MSWVIRFESWESVGDVIVIVVVIVDFFLWLMVIYMM